MNKESVSKGDVADDKEIPLENELPLHRKSSSAQEDPSCFITDESMNTSGGAASFRDDEGEEIAGSSKRGSDNTDGSTFSSCVSTFSTKEEQEQQEASSDPEVLNAVMFNWNNSVVIKIETFTGF